jgi:acetylornithine deacetylase/succinyl-diaminopimelate desuccinylase-like protein
MRANHYDRFEPEYIIDEGGFGSRDLFAPGKLVFGISVAEEKILWLTLRAEGVAGHGSQPHDQNPNDRLTRALARLLGQHSVRGAEGDRSVAFSVARDRTADALRCASALS